MKQRLNILKSKLMAARIQRTFKRDRLTDLLGEVSVKKIGLVIAGAGYGKTTLVAQTLAAVEADTVWYALDEFDRDFCTFSSYLAAGIRNHLPDFGTGLVERLATLATSGKSREAFLLDFVAEIESRISKDLILVLDDYHLVQESPEISEFIEVLLAGTLPTFHLILAGRSEPPLKLSRYRARLEVVDLGEEDLAFRADEIESLYRHLQFEVGEEDVRNLFEKTGGWAAGLMLFYNAFRGKPPAGWGSLFEIGQSRRHIFQYLEENIFERQLEEVRDFMVRSSPLDRLDPEFCDRLLGREDSLRILTTLVRSHLLTFPCGEADECFQYHHLLRDFLLERLKRDLGKKEVQRLYRDISAILEERGDISGALHYFLEGDLHEEVCRVVVGMGLRDLLECPLRQLMDAFERIPPARIQRDPGLLHIRAKFTSLEGKVQQAIGEFQTALERFQAEGDPMGAAACLKDLCFHLYLTGDLLRAHSRMKELWGFEHQDPFFRLEVAGYLILFSSILGRSEEADSYYESSLRLAAGADRREGPFILSWLDLCYTNRFHHSGDFARSDSLNRKAIAAFGGMGMEPFLPLANFQGALTSFYLGKPVEGHTYAENGLCTARKIGILDHQYAWLSYARGLNSMGKGELDKALADAEEAFDIFRGQTNYWGEATVHELRCMIHRRRGQPDQAEEAARAGLRTIEGLHLRGTEGALGIRLAELLTDRGAFSAAFSLLEKHKEDVAVSKFLLFQRDLLQSRIHAGLGEDEAAEECIRLALRASEVNGYGGWLARDASRSARLLAKYPASGSMKEPFPPVPTDPGPEGKDGSPKDFPCPGGEKAGRIRCDSVDSPGAFPQGEERPLRIRCLGRFEVFRGEELIPRKLWRSTKATKIFKYLVMKIDQGFIPKEVLLELAWPDEDPARTNRLLHVALNALRRLLDPDLTRGDPSPHILRHHGGYRLEIGASGSIDCRDFLRAVETAEKEIKRDPGEALSHYLRAEALYGGALFEEDPYEDWVEEAREKLKEKYLFVLSKIIRFSEERADWWACISYGEKYLSVDKYAEPCYRDLMRYYAFVGETSRVLKTFERCKVSISEDLGFPLHPDTVALYHALTKTPQQPPVLTKTPF